MLTISKSKKKSTQLGWRLFQRLEGAAWASESGRNYRVRPANETDFPQMAELLTGLSADSRYLRFLSPVPPFTPERAEYVARQLWLENPWPTEMLLAIIIEDDEQKVIGLGELHTDPATGEQADFALLVKDDWQGRGVGTLLLDRLVALATRRGLGRLHSEIHPTNLAMRKVLSRQNLPVNFKFQNGTMEVELQLA